MRKLLTVGLLPFLLGACTDGVEGECSAEAQLRNELGVDVQVDVEVEEGELCADLPLTVRAGATSSAQVNLVVGRDVTFIIVDGPPDVAGSTIHCTTHDKGDEINYVRVRLSPEGVLSCDCGFEQFYDSGFPLDSCG
ncbi:MAG: hypothetical protein CME06_13230 [Gemmatimonadetes bacterium]|nr:hypothetical protein [Gemmatimonadota bacterium]